MAISMPMWQWHLIDGSVDNEVNVAFENPDFEDVSERGLRVREAG
ncbi:hypothetical protein [Actinomadura sp. WAC 06369]|nr:hypothetical protein [Actinomadura sp. WAC 06369]